MRLPSAAFKIGDSAFHTTSGYLGTIAGIRPCRSEETLQYLFDCAAFKQWLTIGKLEAVKEVKFTKVESVEEDDEIEYKMFDVVLTTMRDSEVVSVTVHLTDDTAYEIRFDYLSEQETANALHGFLNTVGSVTESLLAAIGMDKI